MTSIYRVYVHFYIVVCVCVFYKLYVYFTLLYVYVYFLCGMCIRILHNVCAGNFLKELCMCFICVCVFLLYVYVYFYNVCVLAILLGRGVLYTNTCIRSLLTAVSVCDRSKYGPHTYKHCFLHGLLFAVRSQNNHVVYSVKRCNPAV